MARKNAILMGLVVVVTLALIGVFGALSPDEVDEVTEPGDAIDIGANLTSEGFRRIPVASTGGFSDREGAPPAISATTDRGSASLATDTVDDSLPTWSESPDYVETIVLAEFQRLNVAAITFDPINCTSTECHIRYTIEAGAMCAAGEWIIDESLRPPINVADIDWRSDVTAGGKVCQMTLTSYRLERPEPGEFRTSAERLRELAQAQLAPDEYHAEPVRFYWIVDGFNRAPVVVENVCSSDCATDGRQMIYIDVPDDATCEEFRGVEEQFEASTSNGGLEERTFCVPNTLVND